MKNMTNGQPVLTDEDPTIVVEDTALTATAPAPAEPKRLTTEEMTRLENFGLRNQVGLMTMNELRAQMNNLTQQLKANGEENMKYLAELGKKYGVEMRQGVIQPDGTIKG